MTLVHKGIYYDKSAYSHDRNYMIISRELLGYWTFTKESTENRTSVTRPFISCGKSGLASGYDGKNILT